jgi:hypothetical protein
MADVNYTGDHQLGYHQATAVAGRHTEAAANSQEAQILRKVRRI